MKARTREEFWAEWRRRAARDLGSLLAETIGVPPSSDPATRHEVELMIAAEQSLSGGDVPVAPPSATPYLDKLRAVARRRRS